MAEQNLKIEEAPVNEEPTPHRRWAEVVDEVAADAHGRAESYPAQGLVPEGGE